MDARMCPSDWGDASYLLWHTQPVQSRWARLQTSNPWATFSFSTWSSTLTSPLCLSARGFTHNTPREEKENKKKKITPFHKTCVYHSAMREKYEDAQPEPGALRIRSPLSPTLTLMVEGILGRRREGDSGTALCSPRAARRQEAGQTPWRWTWTVYQTLTLENPPFTKSHVGKVVPGPAPLPFGESEHHCRGT